MFKVLLDKIASWSRLFKLILEEAVVRVHEFVDEGLGHSSYVIDLGDRRSIVEVLAEARAMLDRVAPAQLADEPARRPLLAA